jgi:hypothetical protein
MKDPICNIFWMDDRPDFYIVVLSKSGESIFHSEILDKISAIAMDKITRYNETKTIGIGIIELK